MKNSLTFETEIPLFKIWNKARKPYKVDLAIFCELGDHKNVNKLTNTTLDTFLACDIFLLSDICYPFVGLPRLPHCSKC